jgi:hypothetical protein
MQIHATSEIFFEHKARQLKIEYFEPFVACASDYRSAACVSVESMRHVEMKEFFILEFMATPTLSGRDGFSV